MSGINGTSGEISIEIPKVGGLTSDEIVSYTVVNVFLFITILVLFCVYKSAYLHVVDERRIEKEILKYDREYDLGVKRYGLKHMQEQDRRELEALEKVTTLRSIINPKKQLPQTDFIPKASRP